MDFGKFLREKIKQSSNSRQQPSPRWKNRMNDARSRGPLREDFNKRSRRQIIVHHEGRQLRHANPAQRRQAHLHEIVRDETGLVRNKRRFAFGAFKTPLMRALRRAEINARQARKIGRRQRD